MRLDELKDQQKCRKVCWLEEVYIKRAGDQFVWNHGGRVQLEAWCLADDFELIEDDPAKKYADLHWRREALTDNAREALRAAFNAGREHERANRPKIDVDAAYNGWMGMSGVSVSDLLHRINDGEFLKP